MSRSTPLSTNNAESQIIVETTNLIVGAGPAGASLACFLAQHGLKGIMISSNPGTTSHPGAHITNMAALECLRDIGLEAEILKVAAPNENMQHSRWCYSMAGEEFGRVYAWGNDPVRMPDYDAASPCKHVDCPQPDMEPVLVRYATHRGFKMCFDTTFLRYEELDDGVLISTVRNAVTGQEYRIRSKYLFGADGGRSQVVRELNLPLIKQPGQGLAVNVIIEADLSHLMPTRMGNLHFAMQPDREQPPWCWWAVVRMIRPWTRWLVGVVSAPGYERKSEPTREEYLDVCKRFIGDDSVDVKILDVMKWNINDVVAEYYSERNIFCLGDAVHRHPPFNGLGSNTCVQDAYNLAWKVAYVEKGLASRALLDSYSIERQPVGAAVVQRANAALRESVPLFEAMGMLDPDISTRREQLAELTSSTSKGAERRKRLKLAIKNKEREFHGLGIEMNQHYVSGAVILDDETASPPQMEDPVLYYKISTYPGKRLPHAWLNTKIPSKQFSTIDLAGHGKFCLFTGPGGEAWKSAAKSVGESLGLKIATYSIGWGQDYEDVYLDWASRREVEEDGCVLVRPDRFVAWRSMNVLPNPEEKLQVVLQRVLGH